MIHIAKITFNPVALLIDPKRVHAIFIGFGNLAGTQYKTTRNAAGAEQPPTVNSTFSYAVQHDKTNRYSEKTKNIPHRRAIEGGGEKFR